jgi:uncharacterized protein YjbI with pentapeptide repeats
MCLPSALHSRAVLLAVITHASTSKFWFSVANLGGADLSGSNLREANLSGADLSRAITTRG